MHIQRQGSMISLDQYTYLNKVLEHCDMQNAHPVSTPLPAEYHVLPNTESPDSELHSHF